MAFAQAGTRVDAGRVRLYLDRTIREERRMNARQPRRGQRRTDPATGPALTPREMQIAELVSRGLTNRQIGDTRYLSHKTVDIHLTRVYAKLGVSRRAAVAGRLAQVTADHHRPSDDPAPPHHDGTSRGRQSGQ